MQMLTPEQLTFFRRVFHIFCEGDPVMKHQQLALVMNSLGCDLTQAELEDLVHQIDLNGDGTIDFEEFLLLVFRKVQQPSEKQLRKVYGQLDRDSSKLITETELRDAMTKLGYPPSAEQLSGLMQQADFDEDGFISFQDFYQLMVCNSNSEA